MGILQKKRRTTGKKALAYRGKGGQNTGTAFIALRLGVVLYLLTVGTRHAFFSITFIQASKQCLGADRAPSRGPESRAAKTPNHPQRKPPLATV